MSRWERWELSDRYMAPEIARRLLGEATALARLADAPSAEERLAAAQRILADHEEGDVPINAALDLWSAGACLIEVVSAEAGYQLHSPEYDAIYERTRGAEAEAIAAERARRQVERAAAVGIEELEREGSARDDFLQMWLHTSGGVIALPAVMPGAEALIGTLLEMDAEKRSRTSAAELLSSIPFLSLPETLLEGCSSLVAPDTRDVGEMKQHQERKKAKKAEMVGGRWYGITGCTCDGCAYNALGQTRSSSCKPAPAPALLPVTAYHCRRSPAGARSSSLLHRVRLVRLLHGLLRAAAAIRASGS